MKARDFFYEALRASPLYPWQGVTLLGVAIAFQILVPISGWLLVGTIAAFLGINGWWVWREVLPANTPRGSVRRRFDRLQRAGGVASPLDIAQRASRAALRLNAAYLRPSLVGVPRRRIAPTEVGILVGRTGTALTPHPMRECWVGVRDVVMVTGGPGTNKTVSIAEFGIVAPGALVTTSSRTDLAKWVHRARKDRPVHIFNPTGKGDLFSTIRWTPLVGCHVYETAQRRAIDMLPESRTAENEPWYAKAEALLGVLLLAANLGGYRMVHVLEWLIALNRDRANAEVERTIINALDRGPDADSKIFLLRSFLAEPEKTKGSVGSFVAKAVAWSASMDAREIGDVAIEDVNLDVAQLIQNRETLHAIGHGRAANPMSPLISALVAELLFQARDIAAAMPGGRLDPPLRMLLDEAAVAVRLPLDEWTADAGGDGIQLIIGVQSFAQLAMVWGKDGAETIKGNCGAIIVFGGGWNTKDLQDISELTGTYLATVVHPQLAEAAEEEGAQRDELKWVPVMSASDISNMLPGTSLILKRGLGGVFIGHTPTVLDRRIGWLGKRWTPDVIEAAPLHGAGLHGVDSIEEAA